MQDLRPEVVGEIFVAYLLVVVPILMWFNKLPAISTVGRMAALLNTSGGHIMLLGFFSFLFFVSAARYIYFTIPMIQVGKVVPEGAWYQMGMSFFTSTAFASCFGALLKTLTGEKAPPEQAPPEHTQSPSRTPPSFGGGEPSKP